MHQFLKKISTLAVLAMSAGQLSAYSFYVHQNFPEESVLYMEFQGTNQQRWAADYLKAKAGGRYTGTCVILGRGRCG
jgi:hypothetical protein